MKHINDFEPDYGSDTGNTPTPTPTPTISDRQQERDKNWHTFVIAAFIIVILLAIFK